VSCGYDNGTAGALNFGESLLTNEQCVLVGVVYSAQPGTDLGTSFLSIF
jgi:hypothetical protein